MFPDRLVAALGLNPIPAPGQKIVWRGVSYAMSYARAHLVLADGIEEFRWDAIVGFTVAPIPYIVLGHSGCLELFNVTFFGGNDLFTEVQKNKIFP